MFFKVKPLIFLEINNPQKMNLKDQFSDESVSGITQNQRLLIWEKLNAKIIDFNYIQPPLGKNKTKMNDLLLAVIGKNNCINSEVVYEHLLRFFNISVFKGNLTNLDNYLDKVLITTSIKLLNPTDFNSESFKQLITK